jgi:peptide/nickel transport system permease protein
MGRVVLVRLATAVPLLLATSLLAFLLIHWAPGSFLDLLRFHPGIPESVVEEIGRRYGLDRPWIEQYGAWILGLTRGDFGPSLSFQRPVSELLRTSVPRTVALAIAAHLLSLAGGLALGLAAVARRNQGLDRWACRAALVLVSIHPIVLAIVGLSLAAHTRLLPLGGGSSAGASSLSFLERGIDYGHHLLLPAATLTLFMLPAFFLHARGVLLDLLPSAFVRAGRASGLSESTIRNRYVLPVALVPLVSFAGSSLGRLLNGAFLVEVVTGWPGMGRLALTALRDRDPFLLLGTLVVAGAILAAGNLLADLLLAEVDPRIRLEESSS